MDALEIAKDIELEGKAYYEKLAADSPLKFLSGVFSLLAKEEQVHYNLFDTWQKNKAVPAPAQPGSASAEAKRIFSGISKQFTFPQPVYDYVQAWGKALEMERNSISVYEGMLAKAVSPDEKGILNLLIVEEQKHEHLVEHLLEFANEPTVFLENAEFNHLA
jgi:rubrerythrin